MWVSSRSWWTLRGFKLVLSGHEWPDPEISLLFWREEADWGLIVEERVGPLRAMYVIEALHPDGWRMQGRFNVEYWAYQEAHTRCCSDGRNYRILRQDTGEIVTLVDVNSCRIAERSDPATTPIPAIDHSRP
jgi:hypothetical protein